MVNTYTSDWIRVSNGNVTTHNPQELVGTTNDIVLSNVEIQWEGVDKTVEEEVLDENGYTTGYSGVLGYNVYDSKTINNVPTDVSYEGSQIWFTVDNNESNSLEVNQFSFEAENVDWRFSKSDFTVSGNSSRSFYDSPNEVLVGDTIDINISFGRSVDDASIDIEFDFPYYTTVTNTYSTYNPRVTRDVSGTAGDIELFDGTQTAWKSLSGLEPDQDNEFYHDIDGSGEAYFRFKFDWEPQYPTALKQLRVSDVNSDATYKVALADPNDTQLQYNGIRTSVDGTTYAIDVVDSISDTELETHRMYHPTHGTLYLRPYDTA